MPATENSTMNLDELEGLLSGIIDPTSFELDADELDLGEEELDATDLAQEITVLEARDEAYKDEKTVEVAPTPKKTAKRGKRGKNKSEEDKLEAAVLAVSKPARITKKGSAIGLYVTNITGGRGISLSKNVSPVPDAFIIAGVETMRVKVRNKALDLLRWALKDQEMSVFMRIGCKFVAKNSEFTQKDLVDHFASQYKNKVKSYARSTAMPQAANVISTLHAFGVIDKTGNNCKHKAESTILEKILKTF